MLNNNIKQVLEKRASLHIEDDFQIEECRNRLIELLSINEIDTINFLDICNREEVLWISEVFEEVAYNLQSTKYIECLKKVDNKFTDLNLTNFVKFAKDYME